MKRLVKRSLAILLSLIICISMVPMSVFADETLTEDVHGHEEFSAVVDEVDVDEDEDLVIETDGVVDVEYLDDIYRSVEDEPTSLLPEEYPVEEGSLAEPSISFTADNTGIALFSGSAAYATVEEAAVALREGMKSRETEISISYKLASDSLDETGADVQVSMNEIYTQAIAHTGVPTEGDYLRWHIGSMDATANFSYGDGYYTINAVYTLTYYTTAEQEEAVDAKVSELITELNLNDDISEYQKVSNIYDYICSNVTYDYDNLEDETYLLKHSAYAALINNTAVCQGYSLLFYRLALEAGIDSRLIAGEAGTFIEMFENYELHSWNIVNIDNLYYNLDPTWDAGKDYKNFFLQSDDTFNGEYAKAHKRLSEYTSDIFVDNYPMSSLDNPFDAGISGSCGEHCFWQLKSGVLTISGEGNMHSYWLDAPWHDMCDSITYVRVEEGVTSIGAGAFWNCTRLRSISLPNTLSIIESDAFRSCMSLSTIYIPDEVSVIGDTAFNCCYSLHSVTLPDSLTVLSELLFNGCSSLKHVDIPSSLQVIEKYALNGTALESVELPYGLLKIGYQAFSGTAMSEIFIPNSVQEISGGAFSGGYIENIVVDDGNDYYISVDGVLFSKDGTKLISYPGGRTQNEYVIPDGTISIDDGAFEHSWNLTGIVFPEGMEIIGVRAFSSCRIQEYNLPDSIREIKDEAFLNNLYLTDVSVLSGVEYGVRVYNGCRNLNEVIICEGVREIQAGTFGGCGFETVYIPDSVFCIGDDAFSYCRNLGDIAVPDSVRYIGENAFWGCDGLMSVNLGYGIIEIKRNAFWGCNSLETLNFNGTATRWDYVVVHQDNDCLFNVPMNFTDDVEHEHEWSDFTKDATCTEDGFVGKLCLFCGETVETTIVPAGHNYEQDAVVVPDCTAYGYTVYVCKDCNEISTGDIVEALGHLWDEGIVVTEPTCFEAGSSVYTCTRENCGVSETHPMDKLPHEEIIVPGYDPTCKDNGLSDGIKCSVCDEILSEQMTIPATGHTPGSAATCTAPQKCTACGDTVSEALGHAYVTETDIAPTCDNFGQLVQLCSVCGHLTVEEIPAIGHKYDNGVITTFPTCEKAGTKTYTCQNDKSHTYTEVVDALGHTEGTAVEGNRVEAKCEVAGSYDTVVYCAVCDEELSRETTAIPAIGHKYDNGVVTTAPTCEKTGVKTYTCQNDKSHKYTEVIPAKGHTAGTAYTENEVAATCEIAGSYDTVVYCTVCKAELSRETTEIPAIGHKYDNGGITTAPTCEKAGVKTFTCQNDKSHTYTEVIPATGHLDTVETFEDVYEASCESVGEYVSVISCTTCGEVVSRTKYITPELGHDYDPSIEAGVRENYVAPTCTSEGWCDMAWYCKRCNVEMARAVVFEVYAKLPHTEVTDKAVAATCTTAGKTEGKHCSVCGTVTVEQEVVPATGHTKGAEQKENVVNATCTSAGSYDTVTYCTVCDAELSRETTEIPAIGHKYDNGVVTTAPSCETTGIKTFTCQNDKSHTHTEVIPATGHLDTVETFEDIYEASCESVGEYVSVISCTTCGEVVSRTKYTTPELGHDYDPSIEAGVRENYVAPTCTSEGWCDMAWYCKRCNVEMARTVVFEVYAKLPHTEVTDKAVAATCTTAGKTEGKHCSVCGTVTVEQEVVPATGHTKGAEQKENVVNATCTTEGFYDTVTYCTVCKAELSRVKTTVPAIGHKYDNGVVTTAPSCEATGVKTFTCQNDKTHTYTEAIPAKGHTEVKDAAVAPTCEKTGLTEGKHCSVCNKVLTKQEVIPALGHNYIKGECTNCGDTITYVEPTTVKSENVASSGKIKLTWTAVDNAEKYEVYRSTSKTGKYSLMKTVTDGTSYTNTSAVAGKYYYYYVVAVHADGTKSEKSNVIGRTCDLARPTTVTLSNVAASGKIKVSWTEVEGAEKYQVFRSTTKNGSYTLQKTTAALTWTDANSAAGKTYYYKVKAVHSNTSANSALTSYKSRMADLARPATVTLSNVASTGKIKVSWTKVDGAAKYQVYRATSKTGTYSLKKTTTSLSWTDTNTTAGKTYYYKVKAVHSNTNANSAYSTVVSKKCTK